VNCHGPCLICSCPKFTWVSTETIAPGPDLPEPDGITITTPEHTTAIGPDDDLSWCSRCGGRDPECYICGRFRQK
jgi:hypothetical protein